MEGEEALEDVPYGQENGKYWNQRYLLFEKYDEGIQMDKGTVNCVFLLTYPEGWYSATPEAVAQHIAERFLEKLGPNALVIDAMAGVGGNAIQFALLFPVVFGFDLSYDRLLLSKNNAAVYGVQNNLELVRGDATCLARHWRVCPFLRFANPSRPLMLYFFLLLGVAQIMYSKQFLIFRL